MSFVYANQPVVRRVTFAGAVTGTPSAQVLVEGTAVGSPASGTGSGAVWVFTSSVPGNVDLEDYVDIVASGVTGGVTQEVSILSGTVVEVEPLESLGIGTGARTVVLTVTVENVATQGARVRVTKGGESYLQRTNVSGQVTFNLDDGTWIVAITLPGAIFTGASIVVSTNNQSATYDMDSLVIDSSDPGKVTAFYLCLDEDGDPVQGVSVVLRAKEALASLGVVSGVAIADVARTATSDANGIASFANVMPGYVYTVMAGGDRVHLVEIPSTAVNPFPLRSIVR